MKGLSLCMIVRNEERHIRRCLDSVKDVVNEMVIVDTGSTDGTVGICRSYGASVYEIPWNNSFAEARNYALDRATGDWLMYLDADEELDAADRFKLKDAVREQKADLLAVKLLNYTGDVPDPDQAYLVEQYRLFRNGLGFRFKHDIHEVLSVGELKPAISAALPITVHHYGYLQGETETKRKFARNMCLLDRELARPDHDPWMEYHAASEFYRIGMYDIALQYINVAIVRFLQRGGVPPSMLYKLKYEMLLTFPDKTNQALSTIDFAIRLHPDYVDLHYYKGILLYREGNYREALESFDRCLSIGENNLRHLTLKGAGSYRAWHYKGKCWVALGDEESAESCFRTTLELSPNFAEAAIDLSSLSGNH